MTRFRICLPRILKHEGGFVNHPKDPGGATNKGITLATYRAWRNEHGLKTTIADLKAIPDSDVAAIYAIKYWNVIRGFDIPTGLDYAVFDFAVNSGPYRSATFLQYLSGVNDVDGYIGPLTIGAIYSKLDAGADLKEIMHQYCDARINFLKSLKHWDTFGKGWTSRVEDVRTQAINDATTRDT